MDSGHQILYLIFMPGSCNITNLEGLEIPILGWSHLHLTLQTCFLHLENQTLCLRIRVQLQPIKPRFSVAIFTSLMPQRITIFRISKVNTLPLLTLSPPYLLYNESHFFLMVYIFSPRVLMHLLPSLWSPACCDSASLVTFILNCHSSDDSPWSFSHSENPWSSLGRHSLIFSPNPGLIPLNLSSTMPLDHLQFDLYDYLNEILDHFQFQ